MAHQAVCNTIACDWMGTVLSGPNSISEAYAEAGVHKSQTLETYATGAIMPHSVIVKQIDESSPEFEERPPVKESVG